MPCTLDSLVSFRWVREAHPGNWVRIQTGANQSTRVRSVQCRQFWEASYLALQSGRVFWGGRWGGGCGGGFLRYITYECVFILSRSPAHFWEIVLHKLRKYILYSYCCVQGNGV